MQSEKQISKDDYSYCRVDLVGIECGLRHGQIFEILICLSIEAKRSV